jgi:hypothetical protein
VKGYAMDSMQRESVFAQSLKPNGEERGQVALVVDGKTLRSTIPMGETRDVHLLTAYLPSQRVVLAQMQVEDHTNCSIT